MPKDKLQALQLKRLKALVERTYHQNSFYRQLYDEAGVKPGDLRHLEDVRRLPFLEKRTVRDAYPYGMALAAPGEAVELHATSGTTGKLVPVFATKKDLERWTELNARELWMVGLRPGDILQNAYGYGLPTGGFGFHYGALAMNLLCIPTGTGQTDRQIDFILDFGVTAICMTPSYGLYLGQKALERGINLARESKLRIGLFGAEPWPWSTRLKLEELFGITAYDEYGMTECLGPGMSCECQVRDGMHTWADAFLVECINPVTGEWIQEGEEGELVWTWLTGDGTAVIRYRSRDLSRLWWEEKCPCGRTHPKIGAIKGRTDDAVSIGGLVVFSSQVEDALARFPEMGANFRLIVESARNLDRCTLKCEVSDRVFLADNGRVESLCGEIARTVQGICGITPRVELVPADSLPRVTTGEGKTASARVEDRRKGK